MKANLVIGSDTSLRSSRSERVGRKASESCQVVEEAGDMIIAVERERGENVSLIRFGVMRQA